VPPRKYRGPPPFGAGGPLPPFAGAIRSRRPPLLFTKETGGRRDLWPAVGQDLSARPRGLPWRLGPTPGPPCPSSTAIGLGPARPRVKLPRTGPETSASRWPGRFDPSSFGQGVKPRNPGKTYFLFSTAARSGCPGRGRPVLVRVFSLHTADVWPVRQGDVGGE